MHHISITGTSLWANINHLTVVTYTNDASVYKCAHFYDKGSVSPQNLSYNR
jgi:hypothetical protein